MFSILSKTESSFELQYYCCLQELFSLDESKIGLVGICSYFIRWSLINPLPDMPILGSFNSRANKDMMLKI